MYDPEKGGRRQIYGSAVVCRQDGDFLFAGSTAGVSAEEDYEEHLERLIADNGARYERDQGQELERLVIYLFKRTGRLEVNALQAALKGKNAEFALMHVNRDSPLGSPTSRPRTSSTRSAGSWSRWASTTGCWPPATRETHRLTSSALGA